MRDATQADISVANLTIGRMDPVHFVEEAAAVGLQVGVEFMIYRDIRTAADALTLAEATGRRNVGLILDALHIARAGTSIAELADIPPERIAYAQLCDAVAPSPPLAIETPVAAEAGWTKQARLHEAARRTLAFLHASDSPIPNGEEPAS